MERKHILMVFLQPYTLSIRMVASSVSLVTGIWYLINVALQGRLLLLVTDHGFVNEQEYVWQFLQDIDGDGDFLDARFKRSKHSRTQTAENQSSLSSPSPTPPSLTSPMADDRVQE